MTTRPNSRPAKPRKDFPLFPEASGQWAKKVHQKKYYFGSWTADPTGEQALKNWLARKDAIYAGLDKLRVAKATEGKTVGQVMGLFLEDFRAKVIAKEKSLATFKDYTIELQAFVNAVGPEAQVASLRPEHFAAYNKLLLEGGRPLPTGTKGEKLGRHARRRIIRYIQAMLNWGAGNGWYAPPIYGNAFVAPDTRPNAMRQDKARRGIKDYSERIVTGAEIDALLEAATPNFKAIILLSVNCGLGPADLGRLRWGHINMDTGKLDMPRGKTGAERKSYLWKRTREALQRVSTLKHTARALDRDGDQALVFWSRKGLPMYRELEVAPGQVKIDNSISGTFSKLAKSLGMKGVTQYRLRHTFKTLGKKAKDRDALNLMMGHVEGTTGETYDHEMISLRRVKRVALKVKGKLWPKPKADTQQPRLRLAGVA